MRALLSICLGSQAALAQPEGSLVPFLLKERAMLNEESTSFCPECVQQPQQSTFSSGVDRRDFLRAVGGVAAIAGISAAGLPRFSFAEDAPALTKAAKPAEGLVKEFYASLSAEQKSSLVLPWNHGANGEIVTRLK